MKRFLSALKAIIDWGILLWIEILPYGPGTSRIKTGILRLYGATVGNNLIVYSGVWIRPVCGLTVGDNVSIGKNVIITAAGIVTVGNNVLLGHGSKIISANHIIPEGKGQIRFSGHKTAAVIIEDDVWIAAQAVILPGVRIAQGAVVAAGAVVARDVPSFAVVGGVPARVIKNRLDTKENAEKSEEAE